ncbi:MAG: 50S ribosomal protein L5 [Kiritimatiellaeota bacterium]|nr:50S ribosomal protein L5 [Kiritimatiellota bacterium]
MANLKNKYIETVVPGLKQKFGIANPMQVPKIEKVILNMGFGILDKDAQKAAVTNLAKITGQQPVLCASRKSISNFKLRDGQIVGAKVTLRGGRMYDFLERMMNVALPRIRDFRGVPNRGFDGRGNYTIGIKEESIFPEVDRSHTHVDHGMDITIVTTAPANDQARELLALLGMPFAGR